MNASGWVMRTLRNSVLAATGGVLAFAVEGSREASAQGVVNSPRGDYDPKGMPLGGFRLFPALTLDIGFDDNIYRTPANENSSLFFDVAPRLDLRSQWANHMLNVHGGLLYKNYTSANSETHTDWDVGANGRLDIVRGADIAADISYLSTRETRFSPDLPGSAAKPTPFAVFHSALRIEGKPARFGVS